MGVDKSTLRHPDGGTFLQHAIQRLRRVTGQVAVSVGECGDIARTSRDLRVIPDLHRDLGPAMALHSVLSFAIAEKFDAVLVTPVDMPDLTSTHLAELLDNASSDNAAHDRPTCALTQDGRPHPMVCVYPTTLAREVAEVAHSDHRSLHRWLLTTPYRGMSLPPAALRNVNTPDQLHPL